MFSLNEISELQDDSSSKDENKQLDNLPTTQFEHADLDFLDEEFQQNPKFNFPKFQSRNLLDLIKEKDTIKKYLKDKKSDIFKVVRVSRRTIKK